MAEGVEPVSDGLGGGVLRCAVVEGGEGGGAARTDKGGGACSVYIIVRRCPDNQDNTGP